jgi:hypothetical protein
MKILIRVAFSVLSLCFLNSCNLFDSGIEWRGGPYALIWIDKSGNVSLSRELSKGTWIGRVDATVFAVGWDGRYAVAKQHPLGDKTKTYYFIVDATKDFPNSSSESAVIGPLDVSQYNNKVSELKLPAFTKVISSLE